MFIHLTNLSYLIKCLQTSFGIRCHNLRIIFSISYMFIQNSPSLRDTIRLKTDVQLSSSKVLVRLGGFFSKEIAEYIINIHRSLS